MESLVVKITKVKKEGEKRKMQEVFQKNHQQNQLLWGKFHEKICVNLAVYAEAICYNIHNDCKGDSNETRAN